MDALIVIRYACFSILVVKITGFEFEETRILLYTVEHSAEYAVVLGMNLILVHLISIL